MKRIVQPSDVIEGQKIGLNHDLRVAEFFQWAFSDLCDDDIKGWFAEWLIAKICQIPTQRRVSWANSDLITPEGLRIEIKASAFWQSWKFVDEYGVDMSAPSHTPVPRSQVRFTGLVARDSVKPNISEEAKFKSDVYIFAFHNQEDWQQWSALDIDKWEFYVLTHEEIIALGSKSISLKKLEKFGRLSPEKLKHTIDQHRKRFSQD